MTFIRRSLCTLALAVPTFANAALLQFNFDAPLSPNSDFGVQSGSYFVVDTDYTADSSGTYAGAIVEGHILANDPITGSAVLGGSDPEDAVDLGTTYNSDGSTTWTINVVDPTNADKRATMTLNFEGIDLSTDLVDSPDSYNFIDGSVFAQNPENSVTPEITLAIGNFSVADVSPTPSPVPLPPSFLLMASSLLFLFGRGKLSFSSAKARLGGAAA
jgi:hypothetical protein